MNLIPFAPYLKVALLVAVFAGGWAVNGWRLKSHDAAEAIAIATQLNKAMAKQVRELTTFNDETARREKSVIESTRRTLQKLQAIRDEINLSNSGACRITADGDRLRDEAYRAATSQPVP